MNFDIALKLLLTPLLLTQALIVRKTAASLPEPAGPRSGQCGAGVPLRLLVVGDSSAAGVGAEHQSEALSGQLVERLCVAHELTWKLSAKTGATTRSSLKSVRKLDPAHYDVAIVVLGVNDVTSQIPLANLLRRRAQLYQSLENRFGVKQIVISGIPPLGSFPLLPNPLRWFLGRQAKRYDAALVQQAKQMGHAYAVFDMPLTPNMMACDGFHPAPCAYTLFAKALASHVKT